MYRCLPVFRGYRRLLFRIGSGNDRRKFPLHFLRLRIQCEGGSNTRFSDIVCFLPWNNSGCTMYLLWGIRTRYLAVSCVRFRHLIIVCRPDSSETGSQTSFYLGCCWSNRRSRFRPISGRDRSILLLVKVGRTCLSEAVRPISRQGCGWLRRTCHRYID